MIRTPALDETALEIREAVSRRLAGGFETRSGAEAWAALAGLGALAAPLPEERGGTGDGVSGALPVLEPLGRHGIVVPFLDGVCVPAALASRVANGAALSQLLAGASAGGAPVVLAWTEPERSWSRKPVLTRASAAGGGWRLSGAKAAVRWAAEAAAIVVSAETDAGPGLFLVPVGSPGVEIEDYPTADGGRAGDVRLQGVGLSRAERLDDGEGASALDAALDAGAALSLAEAAGAMNRCLDMTIDYLRTREQFGAPLSRLQALQHRLVDAYALCETSWSLALDAAAALDPAVPASDRALRVSTAKAHVGPAARRVAQEALQLHGAIGMTMEYPLGRLMARLTLIDLGYGDENWHLDRVARCLGAGP